MAAKLPAMMVEATLKAEYDLSHSNPEANGDARKATSMRHIYVDERNDGAPSRGFALRWEEYRDAWGLLDRLTA